MTVTRRSLTGCTRGEVRLRRSAPLHNWTGRSDVSGVAGGRADPAVDRAGQVLEKSAVGRDCNAVTTTPEFVADGPRSTKSSSRDTPAEGSR